MTVQQKELSELILNHHKLQRQYLESHEICSAKESRLYQLDEILKRNEYTFKNLQSIIELSKNKCTNYNHETKSTKRENNNISENTKTAKIINQTILDHNKHDYINKDPKSNNDNQEQSTSKNTFDAEIR